MSAHFETLVIGSGPAGIAAATSAAEEGRQVGLIDDNPNPGGQIWRSLRGEATPDISHGGEAAEWYRRLTATDVTRLQGWTVFGESAPRTLRAERLGHAMDIAYDHLVIATGARERFLPFPGWTLPNVMGVGAIRAMVKSGLPIAGKRVVIAGSGPLLLAVAATLRTAGANVICICEQASLRRLASFAIGLVAEPGKFLQGLSYASLTFNVPFFWDCWPIRAQGGEKLESVTVSRHGKLREITCDYLACGFHLVPNIEPAAMLGCAIARGFVQVDELQRTSIPSIFCAGEPTGIGGLDLSLVEGQIAGLTSAGNTIKIRPLLAKKRKQLIFARKLAATFALRPELRCLPQDSTLICRCEDVPYRALKHHTSWRSAKLHTRCGMGPCQGRVCGTATEFLLGWNADSVRPPVFPARISSLGQLTPDPNIKLFQETR